MSVLKFTLIVTFALALTGCFENKNNTDKLCKSYPELKCERLNTNDGQCRLPRTDLIWHKYETHKEPSDVNKIKEYELVTLYRKCLANASQIQTFDTSKRAERRVEALLFSGEEQERLIQELRASQSPITLYFMWSQLGDEDARAAFLALEGTNALETSEMQYKLATMYTQRDQEKTVSLLHRSLELSRDKNVNTDIFQSLASIHYRQKEKEKAYIWAKVAEGYEISVVSGKELQLLYGYDQAKYKKLDKVADKVESAIKSGKYRRELIPDKY
ncbi:DUF2989 domain-containing protein [Vibrio sp. S4M6]|uniref:DUF2989 domain-containing protein n=1 Tax=Vibrio sinus TaxID=2946865 RepID=UPI00202A5FD1|nr:DUF2989 domain-containing protein [Vibrio sinus]MCL9783078.1 DUF2989 domain-containing protein [Vibrio sinus]